MKADLPHTQRAGGDTIVQKRLRLKTSNLARCFFKEVCERLADVNRWASYGTIADFVLMDRNGDKACDRAVVGMMIRVYMPRETRESPDEAIWFRIVAIEHSSYDAVDAFCNLTIVHTWAPNRNETAKILSNETLSFLLQRTYNLIVASVIRRKEGSIKPNAMTQSDANVETVGNIEWITKVETQCGVFLEALLAYNGKNKTKQRPSTELPQDRLDIALRGIVEVQYDCFATLVGTTPVTAVDSKPGKAIHMFTYSE